MLNPKMLEEIEELVIDFDAEVVMRYSKELDCIVTKVYYKINGKFWQTVFNSYVDSE